MELNSLTSALNPRAQHHSIVAPQQCSSVAQQQQTPQHCSTLAFHITVIHHYSHAISVVIRPQEYSIWYEKTSIHLTK